MFKLRNKIIKGTTCRIPQPSQQPVVLKKKVPRSKNKNADLVTRVKKRTTLSLLNLQKENQDQDFLENDNNSLRNQMSTVSLDNGNAKAKVKKKIKHKNKQVQKIQAQSKAFQQLVTGKQPISTNVPNILKCTRMVLNQRSKRQGPSKSKPILLPVTVKKKTAIAKSFGKSKLKKKKSKLKRKHKSLLTIRPGLIKTIQPKIPERVSSAPHNFGSSIMKELFIRRGIFVPRGYQVIKNNLAPLPRVKTICLEGCRYDVVKKIAMLMGFKEVSENDVWNIIWTDIPISLDKALEMRRFQDAHSIFWGTTPPLQKANHFPGMNEICRKDRLARNLNRMRKFFPTEYNFFPKTWSLPADITELLIYSRVKKNATYICKPDSGCQGRGIFLIQNLKKLNPFAKVICQVYIPRPYLIDGYKFDLRIYILITSCDPLHIYIYNEGIARFATVKYEPPSDENVDIIFMHLTNYSLNKFSQSYAPDPEGSKRKLSGVLDWMESKKLDTKKLMNDIDAVIVKTMIAAQPTLRHYYRASFPKHDRGCACFEILGFDILLDHRLKPFLLEVNHSPSFNLDLPVDAEIKEQLLRDTFHKIYLGNVSNKINSNKRRMESPTSDLTLTDSAGHSSSKALEIQFHYENRHKGNFRLIYPAANSLKYAHFFDQTACPTRVDAVSLARRRAEACNAAVDYGFPAMNPDDGYVVTRTVDENGAVITSKKNKNVSYIKVAFNPEEEENGMTRGQNFNQLLRINKAENFLKMAQLQDILYPVGSNGVREPLTILEGNLNPRRRQEVGIYQESKSMENITEQHGNKTSLGFRKPKNNKDLVRNSRYYDDALNNNNLGVILGSEQRNITQRHRKVIAKDILEKVQYKRGFGQVNQQEISGDFNKPQIHNNYTSSMDRYKLPIPPKVNHHSEYSRPLVDYTNDSLVFKYPPSQEEMPLELSHKLGPYPHYHQGEPHQHQQWEQTTEDNQNYLKNIIKMNENEENRLCRQKKVFPQEKLDPKKDVDRVLNEVRLKRVMANRLLPEDKASLVHKWIMNTQNESFPVDSSNDEADKYQLDRHPLYEIQIPRGPVEKYRNPPRDLGPEPQYRQLHPCDLQNKYAPKYQENHVYQDYYGEQSQQNSFQQSYRRAEPPAPVDREANTVYQVFKRSSPTQTRPEVLRRPVISKVPMNTLKTESHQITGAKQFYSHDQWKKFDTGHHSSEYLQNFPDSRNRYAHPRMQDLTRHYSHHDEASLPIQGCPPHLRHR